MAEKKKAPFEGWTEADFAAEAEARKAALAAVASQMEAEIAQASEATEESENE